MTQQRDIERLLDHWFSDGPDQAPDRVVDIVTDRIERQSQRPAWRLQWRPTPVNAYAKIAVAAAAVLVVALVGYNLLPAGSTGVGGPAATPSPTAAPTTAPTAAPSTAPLSRAEYPAWYKADSETTGAGILPAGKHTTRAFTSPFTYSVPEGWVNDLDVSIAYGLFPDTPANKAEYALSGEMAHGIFMVSVESPYFFCEAWEKTSGTADERAAFLVASDAFAVSEPVDVTIGGLTGKQVDVRLDPDWTETCPGDPPSSDHRGQRDRVTFLDTPDRGVIAIAVGSGDSAGHEAFLAEAMPIIESFQFDTGQ
jgi:hypothetical protein